jgi:hypothetical protein
MTAPIRAAETLRATLAEKGIRRVLVTTFYFNDFSGSAIVALDLARALRDAGAEVMIAACRLDDPMRAVAREAGITALCLYDAGHIDQLFPEVDLVWAQHWPAASVAMLHRPPLFRWLVLSSLSPFEPFESIGCLAEEADAIVFNSAENADAQRPHLAHCAAPRHVLPNSLPEHWFDGASAPTGSLGRLVVISNHADVDLQKALIAVARTGVELVRIGRYGRHRLADPPLLDTADAVVSIGHSVQKALARQRPVFVYDRFGGPGWLRREEAERHAARNFSGRPDGRRPPGQLAAELLDGFAAATEATAGLAEFARRSFSLEANLADVLSALAPAREWRRLDPVLHRHTLMVARAVANAVQRTAVFDPPSGLPGYAPPPPERRVSFVATPADPQPAIAYFALHRLSGAETLPERGNLRIAGHLLPAAGFEPAEMRLVFDHGASAAGTLGQPSPRLGKARPDDARAAFATFEVRVPRDIALGPAGLVVVLTDGSTIRLADFTFRLPQGR